MQTPSAVTLLSFQHPRQWTNSLLSRNLLIRISMEEKTVQDWCLIVCVIMHTSRSLIMWNENNSEAIESSPNKIFFSSMKLLTSHAPQRKFLPIHSLSSLRAVSVVVSLFISGSRQKKSKTINFLVKLALVAYYKNQNCGDGKRERAKMTTKSCAYECVWGTLPTI